jgi:tRNA uridine 5-carbamoylmethylation protein Kti12
MGLTLFVLGLPGSGKSAAARHIKSFARKEKFRPRHFRDYPILYKMFRYVSDHIFKTYYQRDHQQYRTEVAQQLKQRFGVPIEHIHVIHNGAEISAQQFYHAVESFASDMLKIKV